MRFLILTATLGLIVWSSPEFVAWTTAFIEEPVDPHAIAAIELRCASRADALRDECAAELQREFDRGVREPESIVRLHCTHFSSDWAPRQNTPAPICQQIYGGWIEG